MATGDYQILGWYQAEYPFQAESEAELSLKVGDIVQVYAMDGDWWEGELADGRCGLFPANHVKLYTEEESAQEPSVAQPIEYNYAVPKPPASSPPPAAIATPIAKKVVPAAAEPEVKQRADKSAEQPKPLTEVRRPAPKTSFGHFSTYMAYISAIFGMFCGLGNIIWGVVDKDKYGLIYIMCGLYCIFVGGVVIIYEKMWGMSRSGSKTPTRGIVYLILHIFMYFAIPSVFVAPFYLCTAVMNFVAAYMGEEYDAPPPGKVTDLKGEDVKGPQLDILTKIYNWLQLQRKQNQIGVLVFMSLYTAANIIVFFEALARWIEINNNLDKKLSGWAPWAKAFGNLLDLNCAIIVLPVSRTVIRLLYNASTADQGCTSRSLRFILQFVPLDRNLDFHKIVAKVSLFGAIGHIVMHLVNYIASPTNTMDRFGVWPWVSGGIINVCMLFIYAAAAPIVKNGQFEIFWYSHHCFIGYFVFLLLHGGPGYNPNFWKWFIGPGIIYLCERILRIYRAGKHVVLVSVTNMRPNVLALEFAKDQGGFWGEPYYDGQYVFIKCPTLSEIQWHPFTISSAPEEETVTLHIRLQGPGSWTQELADYLWSFGPKKASRFELSRMGPNGQLLKGKIHGPDGKPLIQVDGPHSAPTQHVTEYHTVMVVGGGIGVTPVAATMKSVLLHRWKYGMGQCFPDNAYFYWVCSQKDLDSFRWFIRAVKECEDEMYDRRAKNAKDMNQKRFEFHFFISSIEKGTVPKILEIQEPDDEFSYWGKANKDDMYEAKANIELNKLEAPFTALELLSFLVCPDAKLWTDPKYQHLIPPRGVYIPDNNKYIQMGNDIFIWSGRPDWDGRFKAASAAHPKGDIAVCFCGNPFIAEDLRQMCFKHSSLEDERIFRLHKENF